MPSCLLLQLSHNTYAEVFQIKNIHNEEITEGLGWVGAKFVEDGGEMDVFLE